MQSALRARHFRRPGLPLHAHPDDPVIVHQRATELGEAAADAEGGLADSLIAELVNVLIEAAKAQSYNGNVSGLRTRLSWTVHDAAAARERSRQQTDRQVRRATIAAIVRALPYQAVLDAASRANQESELPMPEADVETIARTEIAIECRRRACSFCTGESDGNG